MYEDEPEDDEHGENLPVTVDKEFNFDKLREAKPSINRIKPPDFNDLVFGTANPKTEPHLVERAAWYKSEPSKGIVLPYRRLYYYCGCIAYHNPFPPAPINKCTINPIQTGEAIMVLRIDVNRRFGITTSQRWRQECWLRLRPTLEAAWNLYRQDQERKEIAEFHNINFEYTPDGFVPIKPHSPGRQPNDLNLSDDDYTARIRLVNRHSTYKHRYLKDIANGKHGNRIAKTLNEMYDLLESLGGVPGNWVKYPENR
ncbi:hypothetical protein LCGC14_1201440 [marine sediment metagenome]|uniref:Uncharacterized protein n=1 Tax=marine sediment metagenome TaxID=412755 RepID=A0A0F9M439_9ZZZZ